MELYVYQGFTLRTFQDQDATSPREWDNVTFLESHSPLCPFKHERNRYESDKTLAVAFFDNDGDEVQEDAYNVRYSLFVTLERFNELCINLEQWNAGRLHLGKEPQTLEEAARTCIEQDAEPLRYWLKDEVYGWEIICPDGESFESLCGVWYGEPTLEDARRDCEFNEDAFKEWVADYQAEHAAEVLNILLEKCDNGPHDIIPPLPCTISTGVGFITGIKSGAIIWEGKARPQDAPRSRLYLHRLSISDPAALLALVHTISADIFQ